MKAEFVSNSVIDLFLTCEKFVVSSQGLKLLFSNKSELVR